MQSEDQKIVAAATKKMYLGLLRSTFFLAFPAAIAAYVDTHYTSDWPVVYRLAMYGLALTLSWVCIYVDYRRLVVKKTQS